MTHVQSRRELVILAVMLAVAVIVRVVLWLQFQDTPFAGRATPSTTMPGPALSWRAGRTPIHLSIT